MAWERTHRLTAGLWDALRAAGRALRLRGPLARDPQARVLHGVVVGLLAWAWLVYAPIILPFFAARKPGVVAGLLTLSLVCGSTLGLLRWGAFGAASWVFLLAIYGLDTAILILFGGIRAAVVLHYVAVPIMAAWLRGARAALGVAVLCLTSALAMAVLEQNGYPLPHYFPGTPYGIWGSLAFGMIAATLPVVIVLRIYHEALESQRATLRLLNNIIDTTRDSIVVKDRDLRVILHNPAAAALVARASVEGGATPALSSVDPDDRRALDGETVRASETVWVTATAAGAAQGGYRTFDMVRAPLGDGRGGVSGVLAVGRDITELLKLQDQLRQSRKVESLGLLAGGIAHDFNNLLTVINGYGDLLLARLAAGDPSRQAVGAIRKAGERAADLTRQLLVFSRMHVVERKRLDLNSLIAGHADMLQHVAGEDVELITELGPAGHVLADPGQLHQVLLNLTVNARDAMPRGGRLTIRTANVEVGSGGAGGLPGLAPGSFVLLTVIDNGIGIPREVQERIFDPFFTTKPFGEGTGLGLSTVYGIVNQAGGAIAVRSEPGHGATFEIYFPRAGDASAAPIALLHYEGAQAAPRGSETILVVEDQGDVRGFAVSVLAGRGYQVLQAASGSEALEVAATFQGPIHLLLTDTVMPRMSGREAAEQLKRSRPDTLVLFMSGYALDVVTRRGGIDPEGWFIAKPFTPAALAQKVREVLGPPGSG